MNFDSSDVFKVIVFLISFNYPGDWVSIPGRLVAKTQKMVHDASLLNTQRTQVRIKVSGAIQGKK